jgi:hypothetical protein
VNIVEVVLSNCLSQLCYRTGSRTQGCCAHSMHTSAPPLPHMPTSNHTHTHMSMLACTHLEAFDLLCRAAAMAQLLWQTSRPQRPGRHYPQCFVHTQAYAQAHTHIYPPVFKHNKLPTRPAVQMKRHSCFGELDAESGQGPLFPSMRSHRHLSSHNSSKSNSDSRVSEHKEVREAGNNASLQNPQVCLLESAVWGAESRCRGAGE